MEARQLALDSGLIKNVSESKKVNITFNAGATLKEPTTLALDSAQFINTIGNYTEQYSPVKSDGFNIVLTGSKKLDKEVLILDENDPKSNAFRANVNRLLQDDDTYGYNIPSSGVPNYLATIFTTRFFKQIYQSTPFREMTTPDQQGVWGTAEIKYPDIGGSGKSKPYGDFSGKGDSSVNLNYIGAQPIMLERMMVYGDLQTVIMGMAKFDYVSMLREYTATLIALDQNNIGFSGYEGLQCWGLKNNPALNAVIPASNGQWMVDGTYATVVADIITTVQSIQTLGAGQVNTDQAFIIGLPPAVFGALMFQNAFGISVRQYIKGIYPNCEFIQVQNYTGTGTPVGSDAPNIMQVIFKEIAGQDTALGVFTTLYKSHGVYRDISAYAEKVSYQLAGTVLPKPIGVATMSGI